ncbi:Anaerobic selenocysteine-containing dehydrogenase [Tistlia consotensis]|uniref:Anaerobic selenocysteine-containing dehydrogenase n=1 Tax=Tistlia consotensis USBA 355 TaxID=560819 RepID=A0A1Y6CHT8_9PROT|nr:molybdopterin-dependent oxidoreductase [Tistlia consotensis]SMF56608.1 Anaerobic selenocysteine-containing dehydrogenase [Tistlia consotensis USBA 355]SNR44811.1 Anaerobic selenocysteine-containing dehydrogenase [Tistlia consotensis]
MGKAERHHGFCALCRSRCGCINVVEEGRLVAVEPDPGHPTGAHLCAKGRAAPELVHHPERLTRPLRRTAPKGAADPGWREIGWDEALDEIAGRLAAIAAESGPQAVTFAITTPSGTAMSDHIDWVERLVRAFGASNTLYATELCNWHKDHATAFTFGEGVGVPDFERAGCLLLWGHNPSTAWLAHGQRLAEARARGARVIVVDPRRAGPAVKADLWLAPRPGTDGALALGLANRLLETGRFDRDFLADWSNGPFLVREADGRFLRRGAHYLCWDEASGQAVALDGRLPSERGVAPALDGSYEVDGEACRPAFDHYRRLCAGWTPERTAAATGVPAEQIEAAASLLWDSRPAGYYAWTGLGQHDNATQTDRALALLYALLGSYDAPGGNLQLPAVPAPAVAGRELVTPEQRARTLGLAERPLGPAAGGWVTGADFCRAVETGAPYRPRALVAFGSNLLLSQPDPARLSRALQALEFHVQAELFMTPTAALADLVLPVSSPWEHEALRLGFGRLVEGCERVQLRRPVAAPPGEARSDTAIVFELATRLGLANSFFGGDPEEGLRHRLSALGLTPEELRARPEGLPVPLEQRFRKYAEPAGEGRRGFATETGRVEVYSELFLRHGYDPVPAFRPSRAAPARGGSAARGDWPLTLSCAKVTQFCHSQHRNLPSLRRVLPEPRAELNPATAAAHGIARDGWLWLETAAGRIRVRAAFNPQLRPDLVVAQFGWWLTGRAAEPERHPAFGEGTVSYNALLADPPADPISGAPNLRSQSCRIAAAE